MSLREEQCKKVCRILDDVLANRPTERDSLIVAVRKAFESLEQFGNSEPLPSAQPEQRWIPVSERMPEPRIDVWCNSDMGQMVGYYDEYTETWYGRDYLELIVTAWMPLPEPYKAGSEDKE